YRPNICPICHNENIRNTILNVLASSSTEAQNIECDENRHNSNGETTANTRINQKVQEFINEILNPDIDEVKTDEENEMEIEEEMSKNGQTISLQMLVHLYDHTCKAEIKKLRIKRETIKWWYKYGENFERKLTEIMSSNRIFKKKATTRLYNELERLQSGVSRDNLRKRTEKSTK
ncbi:15317_t:CDS:2, partial [Dentiscutata heterogama]